MSNAARIVSVLVSGALGIVTAMAIASAPASAQTQPPAQTRPPVQAPPQTAPVTQPASQLPAVQPAPRPDGAAPVVPTGVPLPEGYVIGPDDVLTVMFWRDKDMSGDVAVRPDGKISLPLLNEVVASGLTPEQLRQRLITEAAKYIEDPNVTVVVKGIYSRKVYITGQVMKPGAYVITAPTTVLQLIAMAGGVQEFADSKHVIIMRVENGRQVAYPFNYKDVLKRKNLKQNIELKPGDTVIVP